MRKKAIILFVIFDAVVIGGYLAYKFLLPGKSGSKDVKLDWVTIDASYQPRDFIEESIKNDAMSKGLFPVQIRNYGKDTKILGRFVGKKFANPREAQLSMLFPGIENWEIVDLKYKNERQMEVNRTVLYVMTKGEWIVADSGSLAD